MRHRIHKVRLLKTIESQFNYVFEEIFPVFSSESGAYVLGHTLLIRPAVPKKLITLTETLDFNPYFKSLNF